nr:PREDICTED: uncharacterized protein LOC103985374 isoform X3 [Musa acuminata subsp. malaccensis]
MFFLVMWPLMTGRISRLCVLLPPAGDDASVCCCHCTIYSCVLRLASSHHPTSSFRSCEERRRMGNCQAPEAVVIQHPGGREEQLYWPMSAADVMKSNPGYHVALVTLCVSEERGDGGGVVRLTRVRLLKPKDVLLLGQVYRLVTSQEVTMALRARKQEKLNKCQQHRTNDQAGGEAGEGSAKERHADGSEGPTVASFSAEHRRSCELSCANDEKEKEVYVVLDSCKMEN